MMICTLTSVFSLEKSLIVLSKVELKYAFTFNDARFRMEHCADDTKFQKFVPFALVYNDKSAN
jgi:hypothetical protein